METRILKYFLAVAREGSITGAANFLHVTQPTLSRQIMELEGQFGKKLLKRGNRSASLTEAGILLKKRAEEIIDMVEKTRAELSDSVGKASGEVRIGGGETCAMREIAAAAQDVREMYPGIKYNLYSGNADDVTEKLDKGLLDFGLLIQPADLSKYSRLNLPNKDTWGILMRKDNPLASKRTVRRKDLYGVPLLLSRQVAGRSSLKNSLLEWLGGDADNLNVAGTYNLIYNAGAMVAEGLGCAIALDKLANTGEGSPLCFRPLYPKVEASLSLVWKRDRYFSKPAEIFLCALKTRLSDKSAKQHLKRRF